MYLEIKLDIIWSFQIIIVTLQPEWKGSTRQKKRYAPNLRNENLGNFQSKAINAGEQNGFTLYAWGCAPISFIGFS